VKIQILLAIVCLVPRLLLAQEKKDSSKELEELKGIVDGMNESFSEYRTVVDALRKIKLSGYIQPQFRLTDARGTPAIFSGGAFPTNSNKLFQVRRGRFKVTYDNVLTQYVLQIDATQTGVILKDAYVLVTEPWLQTFGFQMGVFDRPFGYEISYSSGNRESPERARVFQTLFPGEREIGAKLFYAPQMGSMSFLRADVGVFNGSGPLANEFDDFKDLIGHVAGQFPLGESGAEIDLGVSGYFGNVRNNTKYLWDNGVPSPGAKGFVVDSTASNLGAGVERKYFGVDAQFYYDVPVVGGMTIRGEYLTGRQAGSSLAATPPNAVGTALTTISPPAQPTGPMYLRDFSGWYVYLIQNLGTKEQIVLKYDSYDPNTNAEGADFITGSNLSVADIKFDTFGFGFIHHWDEYVKFLIYYEIVTNEKVNGTVSSSSSLAPFIDDVKDNVFTFRTQVKF
jgi:hypothetical protein